MSTVRTRAAENVEGLVVFLVLGAGFVALFAGFNFFWMIWVFGFAVLLPLVSVLAGDDGDDTGIEHDPHPSSEHAGTATGDSTTDALATLRDRYARGDLTDEQFERKLDRLFETEQPESAAEWRSRERERIHERS